MGISANLEIKNSTEYWVNKTCVVLTQKTNMGIQVRVLLEVVLPLRRYDVDTVIELVLWIQTKNHSAYLLRRRRRVNMPSKSR